MASEASADLIDFPCLLKQVSAPFAGRNLYLVTPEIPGLSRLFSGYVIFLRAMLSKSFDRVKPREPIYFKICRGGALACLGLLLCCVLQESNRPT